MYYVNEHIKNTVRIFPEQGRSGYLRLDMNENPEGLPKAFVDEVLKEITPQFLAMYPEPDRFMEKYAAYLGVTPENLCLTNGSVMAIRYIMETFAERGSKVVTVAPSFEMYWVTAAILGLRHVGIEYDENMNIHVSEILEAMDEETDIVALLNPNNPIGNVYTEEEVRTVIEKAEKVGAVVILDEAYHYFCPNTFLPLLKEYDNIILMRTFSKLCSIAGLRLGIAISTPEIAHYLRKSQQGFEVNTVALLFAERILDHSELFGELTAIEQEGKAYARGVLEAHGYVCDFQEGNFFFVVPKSDPKELEQKLRERKILVKTFGKPFLKKYIRISIGSKQVMEQFLKVFLELDAERTEDAERKEDAEQV